MTNFVKVSCTDSGRFYDLLHMVLETNLNQTSPQDC